MRAHRALPAEEPPERLADRTLQQPGVLRVGRRDEPEQERQDLVAVDDHVDRQEEDDEHRADGSDARDRDLLQRRDQHGRELVEVGQDRLDLDHQVHVGQAERIEPVLPRREDRRQILLDLRDRVDELADRPGQCSGHDDEQGEQDRHDQRVDDDRGQGARQPRDARADPGHDRADDEGQQPGEEEREQDVAEEEEGRRQLVHDDEEQRDDPEGQQRAEQASLARRGPDVHRHRRPIRSRTSAIVASAIGLRRSAPASRTPSTSSGWAMSSM